MKVEPTVKRTVAFFDGQNLFHTAKQVFGYNFPNYDAGLLAQVAGPPTASLVQRDISIALDRVGLATRGRFLTVASAIFR